MFHLPITVEWLLTLVLEIHLWYLASVRPSHCSVEADKLIHTVSVSSLWWCQVSVIYPFKEILKKSPVAPCGGTLCRVLGLIQHYSPAAELTR